LNKFLKENIILIIINILIVTAIFSYKIIINPILINEYNFKETVLNIGNIGFCLGWIIGILFFNELFKHKFNFIKLSYTLFNIQTILLLVEFTIIIMNNYNDYIQFIYIPLRTIEGFINHIIISIISSLLTYKMINIKKNSSINGILSSISYFIKFVMPIIAAVIIVDNFPLTIMIIPLIIYISLIYLLKIKEKKILITYHKYMLKNITKEKIKLKKINKNFIKETLNILKLYKTFIKEKNKEKIYFIIIPILTGKIRVFYDFYLILMLINFNYSLKESTFVLSMMMAGMSLHFITGFISEKINYIKLQNIGFIIFIILFIFLLKENKSYVEIVVISFILGYIRTFNWNWEHKVIIENYKKMNENIDKLKTILKLNIEIGTIIGYTTGIIIFSLFSFKGIIIEIIITLIIILLISLLNLKNYSK
jgi:hypothetical protein